MVQTIAGFDGNLDKFKGIFADLLQCLKGIGFSDIRFGADTNGLFAGGVIGQQSASFQKFEADAHLLGNIGGKVDNDGNQIAVAVYADLAGCAVIGGNRRGVDKLNLDVLEMHHSGDRGGCCEGEIGDVDLCVGQGGDNGAFAAARRADKDNLACAGFGDVKNVGMMCAGFLCRGLF